MNLETRECGAVHPKTGHVCVRSIMVEPNGRCDGDRVYDHEAPHWSKRREDGTIEAAWEAVLVVKDVAFNAYSFEEV